MAKLHEILAVEKTRTKELNQIAQETLDVFKNSQKNFDGMIVEVVPFKEGEIADPIERKPYVTTVGQCLKHFLNSFNRYLSVIDQKETTNSVAHADLVLYDKTVLAKEVPATLLLRLEKIFVSLRGLFENIPTLDNSKNWEWDGKDAHWVNKSERIRTKKVKKTQVLHPGNDHHPAQVESYHEDENWAKVYTTLLSTRITSKEKSDILARFDEIIECARMARQRANAQEVSQTRIAESVLQYIIG